ncbi:MAG: hypothetical protein QG552_48, partial [Thermodesulfobacteriota bacterium]|nr:hypothetical protein [Thermodesulfobacteriota bacterium]
METVKNPHDRFFKETFSRAEVALDFVYNYVPQPIAGLVLWPPRPSSSARTPLSGILGLLEDLKDSRTALQFLRA